MSLDDFLNNRIKDNDFKKEYEKINVPLDSSWEYIKSLEFNRPCLSDILNKVDYYRCSRRIYPKADNVLAAFNKTPLDKVRVVILGQDPYHEPDQANGLAFSVNRGVVLPPSLKNIFKELQEDTGSDFLRTDGDLSDWAEQGVLLLNTSLTVEEHNPNSMRGLWTYFTDNIIKLLNNQQNPLIFVLWGSEAQKKEKLIDTSKHFVIKAAHPSPLSAYRGFFGSKPFTKINKKLNELGEPSIKWS